jgi:uncharacterized membrane protein YhiD involved in acid resistance
MKQPAQILQELQQVDIFRPSIFEFAVNLFIALLCGALISLVYRFIRRKTRPPRAFANALVLLSLITAIVTLVIGNNLARAFGLVGTMSIIRFRTAVRDVEDIVFIFFSLTMGMAAGVGLNSVALVGTAVISLVILFLHTFSDTTRPPAPQGFLQITHGAAPEVKSALQALLKRHARRVRLVSSRTLPEGQQVEAFYRLLLREQQKQKEFLRDLRALEQVASVSLFFDEKESGTPDA